MAVNENGAFPENDALEKIQEVENQIQDDLEKARREAREIIEKARLKAEEMVKQKEKELSRVHSALVEPIVGQARMGSDEGPEIEIDGKLLRDLAQDLIKLITSRN